MPHAQYDDTTGLPNLLKMIHDLRRLFVAGGVVIGFDVQPSWPGGHAAANSVRHVPDTVQAVVGDTLRQISAAYDGNANAYRLDASEYVLAFTGPAHPAPRDVSRHVQFVLERTVRQAGLPRISVAHTVVRYPDQAADIAALLTRLHVGLVHVAQSTQPLPPWAATTVDDLVRRFAQTLENVLDSQQLAYVDAVSGLPNHRAAELELADMVTTCAKTNRTFSILLVDGDHLKQYNDVFGYEAGNRLIRDMGMALQQFVRPRDAVYRWLSGDEFLIIMSDVDCDTASATAEYVREAMADHFSDAELAITVSIGVACYPVHGTDAGELIQASTLANILAKQAGRNRVHACCQGEGWDHCGKYRSVSGGPLARRRYG